MSHAPVHLAHSHAAAAGMSPAAAKAAAAVRHKALVKQTEKWVAQSFYGTMLKQMRKSPFHSELFDGGRGGQVFHEMLDQKLADHMSRGAAPKLVNAIVQKIERGKASASYMNHSTKAAAIPPPEEMKPDIEEEARSHVASIG
jgi:Rod binding domain-containing protein